MSVTIQMNGERVLCHYNQPHHHQDAKKEKKQKKAQLISCSESVERQNKQAVKEVEN